MLDFTPSKTLVENQFLFRLFEATNTVVKPWFLDRALHEPDPLFTVRYLHVRSCNGVLLHLKFMNVML
ncbi:hypothetical protein DVH24_030375 [Malus domestica]|uniref:Uncharacterized protein n=1 Tax=Malus domestica TaxID=3750 RepID=A0A498K4Y9_MALDO|nr:hypothetical protein DVH24_030375 [Malus domestica]